MYSSVESRFKELESEKERISYLAELTERLMKKLPENIEEKGYRGLFISVRHTTFILTRDEVRRRWHTVDAESFVKSFLHYKSAECLLNKLIRIAKLYQIPSSDLYSK